MRLQCPRADSGSVTREASRSRSLAGRGQATLEYTGLVALVAAILVALLAGPGRGIAEAITTKLCSAMSTSVGGARCGDPTNGEGNSDHTNPRVARIREHQQSRAAFIYERGGVYADMENRIDSLIADGRIRRAEVLDNKLDYYIELSRRGERGHLLERMWGAENFGELIDRGTIMLPDPQHPDQSYLADSVRYFRVPKQPGEGTVVVDFFIPTRETLGLVGDHRGPRNPLSVDLPRDDSRVMVVIDYETGRGFVYSSNSCTVPGPFGNQICNSARHIIFPDEGEEPAHDYRWHGQRWKRVERQPHQIRVEVNEKGNIVVEYKALNSITRNGYVNGIFEIDTSGPTTRVRNASNDYPTRVWWHYDPSMETARQIACDTSRGWEHIPGGHPDLPEQYMPMQCSESDGEDA